MKTLICRHWATGLAVFFGFVLTAGAQYAPASAPVVPIEPKVLLGALPPAPSNWKLLRSDAVHQYADWQFTVATRQYLGDPVATNPGEKPPEPGKVLVQVTDSAFWPAKLGAFRDFKPGKEEDREKLMIKDCPAIILRRSEKPGGRSSDLLMMLVSKRFIVAVETSNLPKDGDKAWAERINFAVLDSIAEGGEKKLPNPLTMVTFDELNPGNSRSGQLLWTPVGTKVTPTRD